MGEEEEGQKASPESPDISLEASALGRDYVEPAWGRSLPGQGPLSRAGQPWAVQWTLRKPQCL